MTCLLCNRLIVFRERENTICFPCAAKLDRATAEAEAVIRYEYESLIDSPLFLRSVAEWPKPC